MSNSVESFHRNLHRNINFSVIEKIEFITRGQSCNESWFLYRKGHEVKTKLKKGCGSYVNLWQLFQKISGLVFTNPNIPALKYGRNLWKKMQLMNFLILNPKSINILNY